MKQLLLSIIYVLSINIVFSQNQNTLDERKTIFRTWYMKPAQGKSQMLQKGLKEHVSKFHGEGQWPEYYFEVLSGPNSGSFAGWSGPHTWKEFDERERTEGDYTHWSKYVEPYLDNSNSNGVMLLSRKYDLGHGPSAWTDYYHLSWNVIHPGTGAQYREIANLSKKVKEATNSINHHNIYQVVSGYNADMWLWEYPINNMEEMSMSTGGAGSSLGNFEKVLGKEGADRFGELYRNTIKHRVRELQKLRPDMSSPIPEPVNTTSN